MVMNEKVNTFFIDKAILFIINRADKCSHFRHSKGRKSVSYLSVEFTVIVLIYYNFLRFLTLSMIKVNVNTLLDMNVFLCRGGLALVKVQK